MNFLNNIEQNTDPLFLDFSFSEPESTLNETHPDISKYKTDSFLEESNELGNEFTNKIINVLNEKIKDTVDIGIDTLLKQMFFEIGLKNKDINLILSKFEKTEMLWTLVIGLLKIKEKCGNIDDYTLEIPNDPEEGDEDGIFLTVYSNLSVERTMAIVDEIDHEWHLRQSEQFRNLFNYDISYK
ncbi:MAG TPA: hypothetical protein PLD55_02345 [bacterium]|nr:hypothetical protein [bacterium]MDX9805487.1 hypothetical protein [bacterium]HNZ53330.1 hypothetical protein [bacterium]HOG44151.1 hypothetical protein [bacterium]HPY14088.1 hypothetical protein [bacterium]